MEPESQDAPLAFSGCAYVSPREASTPLAKRPPTPRTCGQASALALREKSPCSSYRPSSKYLQPDKSSCQGTGAGLKDHGRERRRRSAAIAAKDLANDRPLAKTSP